MRACGIQKDKSLLGIRRTLMCGVGLGDRIYFTITKTDYNEALGGIAKLKS